MTVEGGRGEGGGKHRTRRVRGGEGGAHLQQLIIALLWGVRQDVHDQGTLVGDEAADDELGKSEGGGVGREREGWRGEGG